MFNGWHTFSWVGHKLYGTDNREVRWACAQISGAGEEWWYEVVGTDGSVAFSGECSSQRSAELAIERFVHSTGGDIAERFANWLVRNREKRGLSRGQLAKRAGLNHSTVRALELGENEPREETRKVLEALFDEEHGQIARIEKLERAVRALTRRVEELEG